MRIFLITDTHFGHRALADKLQVRPVDFETRINKQWNTMVRDEDLVIHLGDLCVGKPETWNNIRPQLPGRKVLVLGNHDKKSISWYMEHGFDFCCHQFRWEMFGLQILFSHKPVLSGEFDLNIHGHLHTAQHRPLTESPRYYLLSLEATDYQPMLLKTVVERWQQVK